MKSPRFNVGILISCAMVICAHRTAGQDTQRQPVIDVRVSRSIQAVTYRENTHTQIDFRGTPLMAKAEGKGQIEAKKGRVEIKAEFDNLDAPRTFGRAYLTYVLWAISNEGQPNNLGELVLDGRKSKLEATTKLQSFGMMVTAEPYFAVTFPSDAVVVENVVRKDTKGAVTEIDAKYELLQRGRYEQLNLEEYTTSEEKGPLALHEARNAVRIAEAQGAPRYAPESWAKAQQALAQAEDYYRRKQRQPVLTASRTAVQAAEDARAIAVKREQDERIAQQQQQATDEAARARTRQEEEAERARAANEQAAQAQAQRDAEEQRRRDAEAQREAEAQRAQQAREQAAQIQAQAQAQQQADAQARAEAEAQRQAETQRAQQAQQQADDAARQAQQAQQQAAQSEREKQELREKLLAQFNQILETRDTPRGLVVNVGDVLFDTGKYSLKPPAREALAKLSGIVLNYPGLKLQVEGHTDSRGSDEFNQKLSEERANIVQSYLVGQGIKTDAIQAVGLGPNAPVADNATPTGRQKNRRVEIIISGEVIGSQVGALR
jgi:outer membrane protein OmpA-like peptidoglycan-associated protein